MGEFDDEAFNECIVFDEDDEKENIDESIAKKPKPTEEQYSKIAAFYQANDESHIEKSVMNELWGNSAAELNDIGPPDFTEAEWKRKWSIRKYNNKKRLVKALAESEIVFETGHTATGTKDDAQQMILQKLDEIAVKQDILLRNQNMMREDLNKIESFSKKKQQ